MSDREAERMTAERCARVGTADPATRAADPMNFASTRTR
jgi:hypothetical protein